MHFELVDVGGGGEGCDTGNAGDAATGLGYDGGHNENLTLKSLVSSTKEPSEDSESCSDCYEEMSYFES
jgi:hypothetical protein